VRLRSSVWLFALSGAGFVAGSAGCGDATTSGLRRRPVQEDGGIDASRASGGSGGGETGGSSARTGGTTGSGGRSQNTCRDSRDCVGRPNGEVICDRVLGQCVQCVGQADCDPGTTCFGEACRLSCTSDRQCTPMGLLCNRTAGLCVQCLVDVDCDGTRCVSGVCRDVIGAGGAPSNGGSAGVPNDGGTNAGGASGSGGIAATGGRSDGGASSGGQAGATGGQPGTGGGSGCPSSEKNCGGICVPPAPSNGCSLSGCTPCQAPPPANGAVVCVNQACDFVCLSGYTRSGNACVPIAGTGGVTGSGGAGGASSGGAGGAGGCVVSACSNSCLPFYESRCCTVSGTCGCKLITTTTCN
jgi:hypothetical protein